LTKSKGYAYQVGNVKSFYLFRLLRTRFLIVYQKILKAIKCIGKVE
jgi:hypothetical protein